MHSTAMTSCTNQVGLSTGVMDLDRPFGPPDLSGHLILIAQKIWTLIGTCLFPESLQRKSVLQTADRIIAEKKDLLTIVKLAQCAKNKEIASQLYKKLIEQNYTPALYQLGKLLYNNAKIGSSEHHEGIGYIRTAACSDYSAAKLWMAEYCFYPFCPGNGEAEVSDDNLAVAIHLAQELLTQGYKKDRAAEVICNAAVEFFQKGSEHSEAVSCRLFKQAADAGNSCAMVQVGGFYEHGKGGCPTDLKTAARFYDQGAHMGDPFGCYYLGRCYHNGIGVQKDLAQAVKWYKRSKYEKSEEGCDLADEDLAEILGKSFS